MLWQPRAAMLTMHSALAVHSNKRSRRTGALRRTGKLLHWRQECASARAQCVSRMCAASSCLQVQLDHPHSPCCKRGPPGERARRQVQCRGCMSAVPHVHAVRLAPSPSVSLWRPAPPTQASTSTPPQSRLSVLEAARTICITWGTGGWAGRASRGSCSARCKATRARSCRASKLVYTWPTRCLNGI